MRADDRVPAVHVVLAVEVMHGPAEAARATGLLAEKFRHAGIRARSLYDCVRVIAISGDEVIVLARGRRCAPTTTASCPM